MSEWLSESGEMAARIRAHDWSVTPLGPLEGWPERLKVSVEQVLANPLVASLVCSTERVLIYNDAAAQLYGSRHPGALGRPFPEAFSEGWATVETFYLRAFAGESVLVSGQALDTRGEGEPSDIFDALLLPVRGADGRVAYVHMTGAEIGARAKHTAVLQDKAAVEAALRRSEVLRRIALSGGRMGSWRWDLQAKLVWGDAAFLELWGFPPSDEPHPLSAFTDRMSAEGQAEMGDMITRAIEAGEEFDGQLRVMNGLTQGRWVRWRGGADLDRPSIINGVSFDVTEQRKADQRLRESEERHAFLLKLSDAVRPLASAADIQGETTRLLREQLNAGWCYYVDWDLDRGVGLVLRDSAREELPSLAGPHDVSDAPEFLRLLAEGAVRTVRDYASYEQLPTRIRQNFVGLGFRSMMMAPLVKEGRLIATLLVGETQVRDWSKNEASLLDEVAERTWAAIERGRAEAALRESEQTLASDLADAGRLRSLSERLVPEESFQAIYDEILSATVAITRADAGTVQIYDPATRTLELIASLNFSRTITDYFHRVDAGSRTACGIALKTGERAFVDFPDEDEDLGCQLLAGEGIQSALAVPLLSRTGTPLGMLNAHWRQARHRSTERELRFLDLLARQAADLIERRQGEHALRESEERFQRFSEASSDILWSRDAETLQWDYLSPAFEQIYGSSRQEALKGNDLRRWLELIEPDDRRNVMGCMRRVREGERVTFEFRIRRPVDGQVRWLRNTDFPIRDASGGVHRIGGICHDITELKATEAALTHSEQRLRTLVEGVPQLVWRAVDHGDWTWASPQWVAFTGQSEPDSHHLGWLEPVHPDDREMARSAWNHASQAGGFEVEYRIRNIAQNAYRWFQTRATPVRNEAGEIVEWLGTSTDIHELRELHERQQVLVAELQHRTRNLMGVVRATADTTLRSSTDLVDFGDRYRDRLNALARVQGLLSRLEGMERITFDELIRSELTAIGAINGTMGKVTLIGPDGIALRSSTVQTFALALHELSTNALKYGALKHPSGHLAVTWQLEHEQPDGTPWLHVNWHESGVVMPPVDAPPQGTGQGRQLIERALPYQLGARTSYVMGTDGVRCSIAVPVSSRMTEGRG